MQESKQEVTKVATFIGTCDDPVIRCSNVIVRDFISVNIIIGR